MINDHDQPTQCLDVSALTQKGFEQQDLAGSINIITVYRKLLSSFCFSNPTLGYLFWFFQLTRRFSYVDEKVLLQFSFISQNGQILFEELSTFAGVTYRESFWHFFSLSFFSLNSQAGHSTAFPSQIKHASIAHYTSQNKMGKSTSSMDQFNFQVSKCKTQIKIARRLEKVILGASLKLFESNKLISKNYTNMFKRNF